MITVRPKIRTNPNFTHYGLKLLVGGRSSEHNSAAHADTGEAKAKEPDLRSAKTLTPIEEVKG